MDTVSLPVEGRRRAVIEAVTPSVDGGRFPIKRCLGGRVVVEADCFADGHDAVAAVLRFRHDDEATWREATMLPVDPDRFRGEFTVDRLGTWRYTVVAWVDGFQSWRREFMRRDDANDMHVAAQAGADLVAAAAARAQGTDHTRLIEWSKRLRITRDFDALRGLGLDETLAGVALRHPVQAYETLCDTEFPVTVERARAGYGAWYEMFPRSSGATLDAHGDFQTLIARLPYVARMGFDVLYLPPIHPIGRAQRKGKNNTPDASAKDVGSPWAIGAAEGGHKTIHPQLGTLAEFRRLIEAVRAHGMELALDIAYQCSPDHPYVAEHPDWFRRRPDGSVQYAENPPKRYQDIYPFHFEGADWRNLWCELESVLEFWIDLGVRIFRIDNPHTKPFRFWEWAIAEVRRGHPDVVFLSEAFTRPKVMQHLAKVGFSQSYTYFTWRNTKTELTAYFTALASGPEREYLRANCWPNTPDILPEYLQHGGRPAFMARLVLAATLAASYGIYGPAFELMETKPREPETEEYLDSEKYQLRHWELEREDTLAGFVERVNRVRRENPALHADHRLRFHETDDDAIICYSKVTEDCANVIVVVVNLDPFQARSARITLDAGSLGLDAGTPYQMHELLTGARYLWSGPTNAVRLDPATAPAHVFRLRHQVRSERDFDYFL